MSCHLNPTPEPGTAQGRRTDGEGIANQSADGCLALQIAGVFSLLDARSPLGVKGDPMTGATWSDVKFLTIYELAVMIGSPRCRPTAWCGPGAGGDPGRPVLSHPRGGRHQLHARRGLHPDRSGLIKNVQADPRGADLNVFIQTKATTRPRRTGRGPSPCTRRPRSRPRTSPSRRRSRRPRRARGARSWSRR